MWVSKEERERKEHDRPWRWRCWQGAGHAGAQGYGKPLVAVHAPPSPSLHLQEDVDLLSETHRRETVIILYHGLMKVLRAAEWGYTLFLPLMTAKRNIKS